MASQILYRHRLSKVWIDISDRVTELPSWTENLSSEPVTCSFGTINPVDSNGNMIYPDSGDFILVTQNEDYNSNVEPLFHGVIDDSNKYIIGFDRDLNLYQYGFNIQATEEDFSNGDKITTHYHKQSMIVILYDLINKYGKPNLFSGIDENGFTIPKIILRTYNKTIDYFEVNELTAKEAIFEFAKQNNLYCKLSYTLQPDDTNLVNVYTTIMLLGIEGVYPPETSEWINGINNNTIQNFLTNNLSYDPNNNNEPEFIPTETDVKLSKDRQSIRNYIKLIAKTISGRFNIADVDNTSQYLVRYETSAVINQDTYVLPYAAQDIVFVAQQITSRIASSPAPTANQFDINEIAWARINNGDVCKVKLLGYDFFRKVYKTGTKTLIMKSLVDGTTTLDLPLIPDATLYDNFEIVGNQDILLDNQINYASTGVVKNITQNEKGQVRFLENSLPPPSEKIVIYYVRIEPYKKIYKHAESIARYGIKDYVYELDYLTTTPQLDEIAKLLEQPNPNITLSATSYRPKVPVKVGWVVPINVSDSSTNEFYKGNLLIYQVTNRLVAYDDVFQSARVIQDVKLQEYRVSLEDIINSLQKKYSSYVNPTGEENISNKQNETISCQDTFTFVINSNVIPPPTYELTQTDNTVFHWRINDG